MVLPQNDISIMLVHNTLGDPSYDLGTLCTSNNINKWSRFRPGYWKTVSGELTFQKPRGSSANDPRGTRFGSAWEAYALGDFRGYDSIPQPVHLEGGNNEVVLNVLQSTTSVDLQALLHLGEVDWFNEESEFHGRNYFPVEYEEVEVILVDGSTKTVIATLPKSSLRKVGRGYDADLNYTLDIKSGGYSYTVAIEIALGRLGRAEAYFPGISRSYKIVKISKPQYVVQIKDAADLVAFNEDAEGFDDGEKAISVTFINGGGEAPGGSNVVFVRDVKVEVLTNFNRKYYVSATRWGLTGIIEYYNLQTLTVTKTEEWSGVKSHNGSLLYNFDFYLEYGYVTQDGYVYRLNLKTFERTTVVPA